MQLTRLLIHSDSFIIRVDSMGKNVRNQKGIQIARQLVTCQLALTLMCGVGASFYLGSKAIISAFFGGLIVIIPNVLFALIFFKCKGAHAARQIVNSFYKGEALKIFLSIILFTLVFKFFIIIPLVFFTVFIMVQMMFWFVPLIF